MNIIFEKFDKSKKCELIFNDYHIFKYELTTIEEANKIFKTLKETNYRDFYFRIFSKDFDYIYNYGEEIYDLEKIEPNEEVYLNENIVNLPKIKAKVIYKDDYPVFYRLGYIQGDDQ